MVLVQSQVISERVRGEGGRIMNLRRSPWREIESVTNHGLLDTELFQRAVDQRLALNHQNFHMRASVQGGRRQLLSVTGRRGAPSPSRTDYRLMILNNIIRLITQKKVIIGQLDLHCLSARIATNIN